MIELTFIICGVVVSVAIFSPRKWIKKMFRTTTAQRLLANSNAFYK
jgi:hypothetical protein